MQFESADAFRRALSGGRARFMSALSATADLWDEAVLAAEASEWSEEQQDEVARFLDAAENRGKHWQLRTAFERKPWTPRDVAVHVFLGETFMLGHPLDEVQRAADNQPRRSRPEYRAAVAARGDAAQDYEDRRRRAIGDFVDPDATTRRLSDAWHLQDVELDALRDQDMEVLVEFPGAPSVRTAGGVLALALGHLNEHAQQLEGAARERRST